MGDSLRLWGRQRDPKTQSDPHEDLQNLELLTKIAEAHAAWQVAMQQFNDASSADVVDDAIYLLTAAEMRYEGLLRIARRRRLCVDLNGNMGKTLHGHTPRELTLPQKPESPSL